MPIYKPTELHQFLAEHGAHPKKRLSQNFLIDGNVLKKITSSAHISPGDLVLEIGPGPGSLTEELLKCHAKVIAVEKDPVFSNALSRLRNENNQLEVYCDDILKFPLDEVLKPLLNKNEKAKVIANLPYHLTTPIIAQLISRNDLFSSLVLMVQEEVAQRFVAKPKTHNYSSFTVFLNFFSHPSYAFLVKRQCFFPAPKVDSAVVILELTTPPKVYDQEMFFILTRTAFKQRRKMLRSSLRELYSPTDIEDALKTIGVLPTARPEELSLKEFLNLFEILCEKI